MHRLDIESYRAAKKVSLVLVLDNIRSEYNVGSIFRTADAFRIESIALCGITGAPPSVEIHKTALGAEDSVRWQYYPHTLEALKKLKDDGYIIIAVEQIEESIKLEDYIFNKEKKYALVLGNEVRGVAQNVVDYCDEAIEIPQYGTKHSLNVSVTAGIVMWMASNMLRK